MKIRFKSDARTLEATPSDRPLSVGRRDGCDLSIIDRSISRLHAELAFRKGDGWYLRDLDSRYGTQVNGLPISAPIRLNEGDHVTFGKIPFTVSLASLEDTGYDTTGLGFMAAPAQPAVVVSRPPAPVASPALPGHDTSPMSRAADAGTRSRKRIIRIPVYSSLDGAIKTVAVLGFIAVTLVVTFLMLRDRGTTQNPRTARDMPATMVDRFPVAPPPPVVPPATPPAAAVAGAPDKTEGDPSAAPGTPAAATKRRPPRRPEPVDVETQPDSAPVSAVGPQRRVTVLAPRMPDGDLEAEQAAMAAAGTESTAPPKPAVPAARPDPDASAGPLPGSVILRNHLSAQVRGGANLFWEVVLNDRTTRYTVQSADANGIRMRSANGDLDLTWEKLGNEGLYNLCQPLLPVAPETILAAFLQFSAALGRGNDPVFAKTLAALREKDPDSAKAIEDSLKTSAAPRTSVSADPAPATPAPPPATPATPVTAAATTAPPPAAPVAPKGWGEEGPAIKPSLLMVARVGGPGDQWLKTVAVKNNIVVAAGEGDFQVTVTVNADGTVRARTSGNLSARHDTWPGLPPVARNRSGAVEFGHRQVHPVLQQPYLVGAGWKLWDWTYEQARSSKAPYAPFMNDSGIRSVTPVPNGDLLVIGAGDGGNTSLRAHPKDIQKPLEFAVATGGGAGKSSYLFEVGPAGDLVRQMVVRDSANAVAWDTWGRILVAGRGILRGSPNVFEYPDGAGILLADAGWQKILFGTSIGVEGEGDVSLVGIDVDSATGLVAACGYVEGDLKQLHGFQEKPGGGKDGLLVLFSLWGSSGRASTGGK